MFVASESGGRKRDQVDPPRACRVSAYGLFDPEGQVFLQFEWSRGFCMIYRLVSKYLSLGRAFFVPNRRKYDAEYDRT